MLESYMSELFIFLSLVNLTMQLKNVIDLLDA